LESETLRLERQWGAKAEADEVRQHVRSVYCRVHLHCTNLLPWRVVCALIVYDRSYLHNSLCRFVFTHYRMTPHTFPVIAYCSGRVVGCACDMICAYADAVLPDAL
jgi:hypothetical protein